MPHPIPNLTLQKAEKIDDVYCPQTNDWLVCGLYLQPLPAALTLHVEYSPIQLWLMCGSSEDGR
jgi:hypothetical protein